jgi:hypothetical protein
VGIVADAASIGQQAGTSRALHAAFPKRVASEEPVVRLHGPTAPCRNGPPVVPAYGPPQPMLPASARTLTRPLRKRPCVTCSAVSIGPYCRLVKTVYALKFESGGGHARGSAYGAVEIQAGGFHRDDRQAVAGSGGPEGEDSRHHLLRRRTVPKPRGTQPGLYARLSDVLREPRRPRFLPAASGA